MLIVAAVRENVQPNDMTNLFLHHCQRISAPLRCGSHNMYVSVNSYPCDSVKADGPVEPCLVNTSFDFGAGFGIATTSECISSSNTDDCQK